MYTKEFKNISHKVIKANKKKYIGISAIVIACFVFAVFFPYLIRLITMLITTHSLKNFFTEKYSVGEVLFRGFFTMLISNFSAFYFGIFILNDRANNEKNKIVFENKKVWLSLLIISVISYVISAPSQFNLIFNRDLSNGNVIFNLSIFIILFIITLCKDIIFTFVICIYATNPSQKLTTLFKNSARCAYKNFLDFIVFDLSFLGWYIIPFGLLIIIGILNLKAIIFSTFAIMILVVLFSPLMFGIGFYFIPYYNLSMQLYCQKNYSEMLAENKLKMPKKAVKA